MLNAAATKKLRASLPINVSVISKDNDNLTEIGFDIFKNIGKHFAGASLEEKVDPGFDHSRQIDLEMENVEPLKKQLFF